MASQLAHDRGTIKPGARDRGLGGREWRRPSPLWGIRLGLVRFSAPQNAFLNELRKALSQVLSALKQQIKTILAGVTALLAQLDHLLVDDLFQRLLTLLGNLETSFNEQINRVRREFDAMLNAAPVGGSRAAAV